MNSQAALPRPKEITGPGGRILSDKAYLEFCEANPNLRAERTTDGRVVVIPPAGFGSDEDNAEIIRQLGNWAKRDGRGRFSGATAQFFLPDGSALSPDAAWTSRDRLDRASAEEKRRFPYLCPEFVIEVKSPSDRLSEAKSKIERWIANGAQLGWLIDADRQTVCIYQPDQPVETRKGILKLAGRGPVKGFVLQLRTIWEGLK